MRTGNLALRLLLELGSLAALGWWGWRSGPGAAGVALALAAPLAFALVWGLLVSPKAPRRLRDPWRIAVEVLLFAAVAGALAAAGAGMAGAAFGLIAAGHLAVMVALGQRGR